MEEEEKVSLIPSDMSKERKLLKVYFNLLTHRSEAVGCNYWKLDGEDRNCQFKGYKKSKPVNGTSLTVGQISG